MMKIVIKAGNVLTYSGVANARQKNLKKNGIDSQKNPKVMEIHNWGIDYSSNFSDFSIIIIGFF